MAFNFFGFKKKPDIQDVQIKATIEEEKTPPILSQEPEPEPKTELKIQADISKSSEDASGKKLVSTREDVLAAYKIFLGRLPESEEVINLWVGTNPEAVLAGFLKSSEFLNHPLKSQFILGLAKMILNERKKTELAGDEKTTSEEKQK
jgi:hypothetical protein